MVDVETEAKPVPKTLRDCFEDLRDPRVVGRSIHKLYDIIAIVLAATIAGCDDFLTMEDYARAKERWLRDRMGLELAGGIPSHDTLMRTMAAIRPEHFQECFGRFVDLMVRLSPALKDKHIAIDGKAMRGSKKKLDAAHRMVHMVGAWSTEAGLALGQVKTEEKSNEITAIAKLLEVLDISGALVTIDAAGCQKEIAAKIVAAKGDYLLQVKGNQERLHDDVQALAVAALESDAGELDQTEDAPGKKQHGRTESRYCVVIDDPDLLKSAIRDFEHPEERRSGRKGNSHVHGERSLQRFHRASDPAGLPQHEDVLNQPLRPKVAEDEVAVRDELEPRLGGRLLFAGSIRPRLTGRRPVAPRRSVVGAVALPGAALAEPRIRPRRVVRPRGP